MLEIMPVLRITLCLEITNVLLATGNIVPAAELSGSR